LASRGYRDLAERPGGWGIAGNILLGINKINAFAKQLQLGLSFFHHFAQMESYIAGFGGAPLNPLRIPAMIRGWKKALKDLHSGAALPWAKAGMEIATKKLGPDTPEDSLGKTLKLLENVAGKYFLTKPLGQIPKALGVMHKLNNYFLWDVLQPGLKIQLADHLLAEAMAERPGIDENGLRRDISNVVNDLFGGQNFAEYLWATPMVRDVMRSMWLAPDWTISAINTARLGEMLGGIFQTHSAVLNKATSTDVTQKFLANRYWPTFIFVLLLGIPNLLQMLIWLFEQKKENPDPNLKPLAVLNEKDKQAHVDVTPLFKAMGFDKFPDRRVYIRYGKQAYELGRWFTGTFTAALTKGSPVLKTAWEQITNKSTMGWDMPWVRNADFSNTATGFWDTRAAALSKQFIPLTALGMLDGRPVTPFTAASLGMSQFKATKDLKMIFSMYVENTFWDQIKGSPPRVQKMQDLVPRIVDGLVANGYGDHVKRIMSNAVNSVARRYNFEIANELQKNPDDPNIGKIAAVMKKLTRLDKTVSNINKSLDQTMKYGLKKYTREQRQAQHKAIRDAWKKTMETRPRD